jgi:hypothetical protein
VAWCGGRGALDGQGAVEAQADLLKRVIGVMVHREGTLVERVLERGEGEERVLFINVNPSHNFTVPGANAAPTASAPAKMATRQKRLSDGTSKPAVTSDDGTSTGTSTEEGSDSTDPNDLWDEDGRLKEPLPEATKDDWRDMFGPEPCDPACALTGAFDW